MPKRKFTEDDHRKAREARSQKRRENIQRAHELKDLGWTNGRIAKELGVGAQTVRSYLKEQPTNEVDDLCDTTIT